MPNINASGTVQSQLNRMNPASADAKLGDLLAELITKFNALLVKLDAEALAASNYEATLKVGDLESRP